MEMVISWHESLQILERKRMLTVFTYQYVTSRTSTVIMTMLMPENNLQDWCLRASNAGMYRVDSCVSLVKIRIEGTSILRMKKEIAETRWTYGNATVDFICLISSIDGYCAKSCENEFLYVQRRNC